ncbi:uncharacterized protein LOC123918127 isoform X2 [Trifolium pratense]|uniref:uncharacterized protein LOC123918127 isoform X2 n=1 Tax=Trifolium pratense TaxID=57577 RepID=UPI001E6900CB|nr:uncharacterized protein LOC123918127 isoform X2 [Trifolium pratense]
MMNLSGEVIGIQCFEVSQTEHGYCIPLDKQNHKFEYDYSFNDYDMTRFPPLAILPLKFIPSNIKQAIAVQYINKVFRKVFKNERASEDCDLNEFISGLFKQRIGKPSSSSAPPTGKSSPLGLTGTMQHTSYEDSRLKSVIRSLAPSVVSVSYFTGIHRIVDCTGFIIDWDVCKGVATVLTSAKLMRSPLDRHDYRIVVRLANGKMLLAEEDYVDYYHNIVTFKVNSNVKLIPLDLFSPVDLLRPLDSYSNLQGVEVVALARDFYTCELTESCGLFSRDYPCFGCVQLASSTCRTTRAGEGGPLITEAGQIIGINFFDGHGFVHPLPTSVIRLCLSNWNSHGIVMQPWLGFTVIDSDSLVVKEVYEGSPADKVGVRSGDSISVVTVNKKTYEFCGLQQYAKLLNGVSDMLSACPPNQTDTKVFVSVNDNSKLVCAENLSVNDKNFCSRY